MTTAPDANCSAGQPVTVAQSHGFLASVVTQRTRRGSADCPWLISAEPRQTVSISLHDFGVWRQNYSAHLSPASAVSIPSFRRFSNRACERSGAERQNFPHIAELHLRDYRTPFRYRSDDFPLRSRSAHMLCSRITSSLAQNCFSEFGLNITALSLADSDMDVSVA